MKETADESVKCPKCKLCFDLPPDSRPINPTPRKRREMKSNDGKLGYQHPTTIEEFETVYREEYEQELASCDKWIKWCENQNPPDMYGVNFHQGLRGALVFNNFKMEQLLCVLKQEHPNKKASQ